MGGVAIAFAFDEMAITRWIEVESWADGSHCSA